MSNPTLTSAAEAGSALVSTSPTEGRWVRRATVTAIAAVAALAVYAVAELAAASDLRALSQGDVHAIGPAAVLATATIAALAGWALLAALERFTGQARRIWTGIAAATLLLSLGGPIGGGVGTGSKVALTMLHVVVGGILIGGLRRTTQ